MQFSKLIGQEEMKSQLVKMVTGNHLSHALLFLGKEGTGGLSLARAFAQYIVCERVHPQEKKPDMFGSALFNTPPAASVFLSDSCGECAACKKAAALIHPDIHFSFPVISKKSDKPVSADYITEFRNFITDHPYANAFDWLQFIGAENRQGNINVHECNEIIKNINLKSFESRYKVLIIWMPEALGNNGNKLLKVLEEPPPDTLILMVAENQASILMTILSRTQLIRIPSLRSDDIQRALEEKGIDGIKAKKIANISGGNFHEALALLEHADDDWELTLRDWLNAILKTGPSAQVKWIDEIAKTGREKQKQFLKYFTHLLEHAIRINALGIELAAATESGSTTDFAVRLNKICSLEQQEAIVKEMDAATYYIERNANAKLLFHALTIRLYHIISNKTLILVN